MIKFCFFHPFLSNFYRICDDFQWFFPYFSSIFIHFTTHVLNFRSVSALLNHFCQFSTQFSMIFCVNKKFWFQHYVLLWSKNVSIPEENVPNFLIKIWLSKQNKRVKILEKIIFQIIENYIFENIWVTYTIFCPR